MKSFMDKCCNECWHSPEKPCDMFVRCCIEGPLCHNNDECHRKYVELNNCRIAERNLKQMIVNDIDLVVSELLPSKKSVEIVAPSFAASFPDNYMKIPFALRETGFKHVVETALGKQLIRLKKNCIKIKAV